jgi:hypothetical protein
MPNENGTAYGLTTLCPLMDDRQSDRSYAAVLRDRLRNLPLDEDSPLAKVPNLYMCRVFVLDDVFFQGKPAVEDHLQSKYLAFVADLHGKLDPFLEGLWLHAQATVRELWQFCIGFETVNSPREFVRYLHRCQVETTFYFNGSNDEPPAEQLKALYLKQELAKFARAHQGKDALTLQRAFKEFVARVEPFNLARPTWRPGAAQPETATTEPSAP